MGYSLTCGWLNVFPLSALCELTLKLLRFWPVNIQPASTSAWPMCHDLYIAPLFLPFPDFRLVAKKKKSHSCSVFNGRKYKMVLTHSVQQQWKQIIPAIHKEGPLGWNAFYWDSNVYSDRGSLLRYMIQECIYTPKKWIILLVQNEKGRNRYIVKREMFPRDHGSWKGLSGDEYECLKMKMPKSTWR